MSAESSRPTKDLADFSVGDRVVRPSLGLIVDGEEPVHVEPRSIDVLIALAERGGEVCSKRELIEAVWGEAFVSDEVLTHAVWDLRKAFGDNASDPRYIQTIPKRGYRLVAPVKKLERETGEGERPGWLPYAVAAAVVLAIAVAVLAAILASRGPEPEAARAALSKRQLLLVGPEPDSPSSASERRLHSDLLVELAGAQGLGIIATFTCEVATTASRTLCLTLELESRDDRLEVQPFLIDAQTGEIPWAPPTPVTMANTPEGSKAAAQAIKRQVIAYLRAIDLDSYSDSDIKPWFDFSRHDTLAITDFLEGITYTYLNQPGARTLLDQAAERDPDFVAPRVWRIGTLVVEGGDSDRLARYLEDLERLYEGASSFERPMIQWALAFASGDLKRQLLELSVASRLEPSNRPVRFMLAATKARSGDYQGAWRLFQRLVERRWRFPGLYSAAAGCAIFLELPETARKHLEYAESLPTVDAETYELLQLLAVYRGDAAAEADYREKRIQRLNELVEPPGFDSTPFAQKLAEMAASEGREAVAKKLRESSG